MAGPHNGDDAGKAIPEAGSDPAGAVATDAEDSKKGVADDALQSAAQLAAVDSHCADFGPHGAVRRRSAFSFGVRPRRVS